MKILHVINSMEMGGAQSLLADLCIMQKEIGYDVTILQLNKSKDDVLEKKIEKAEVKSIILSKKMSVYSFIYIFKLIPYVNKSDVIHVHLFPSQYWVGLAKLISNSSKVFITTEHSTQNKRRNNILFRQIDKFIYKSCYDSVVTCSEKAMETFSKCYSNVNVVCIPNGINLNRYINAKPYSKKDLLGIGDDCFVMGMVARFNYPKRQDVLISSLTELPQNIHVLFVGGGNEGLEKMKKMSNQLGVSDRVHFLGVRSDVPRILHTVDVVVMSSEYEGLSLSSVEGMAVGKPFVCSDVNGLKEVAHDAALLFESGNVKRFVDVVFELYNDPQKRILIAEKCHERSINYDIEIMVNKYIELYKQQYDLSF